MSETTRAIATVDQRDWNLILEQAKVLVPTGFLPDSIKTPQQAAAIVLKGRELGVPTMYALQNIHVISGKPTANAECIRSLVYRDHGDDAMVFTETTAKRATLRYKRRGWKEYQEFTYTIEDAKTAGLLDGRNAHSWRKFPGEMLRARCTSSVGRMAFPDSAGGLYLHEEMGAEVNEAGEIVRLTETPQEPDIDPKDPRFYSRLDTPTYETEPIEEAEYRPVEPAQQPPANVTQPPARPVEARPDWLNEPITQEQWRETYKRLMAGKFKEAQWVAWWQARGIDGWFKMTNAQLVEFNAAIDARDFGMPPRADASPQTTFTDDEQAGIDAAMDAEMERMP